MGITEERVRQIETRARDEYRKIAEAQKVDLLAF
jgi:DNA-directed RNA polymerase sigma subunit (sigma70/sigma32)